MGDPLDRAVASLRQRPADTAVLVDFDGTLAPIVDDPAAARPLPGAARVLRDLARSFGTVAVISGRPAAFLVEHLGVGDGPEGGAPDGPAPVLAGLYGLERVRGGVVQEVPAVAGWREVVAAAVEAARAELPPDVDLEDKGLSLTLHVRRHPDRLAEVEAWARAAARRWHLEARSARLSMELHPPVAVDKGTVVAELVEGCAAACFIGDDVGDLPAFGALDAFAAAGGTAWRVVVSSAELDPQMAAAADVVLDGPSAVLDLLHRLAR